MTLEDQLYPLLKIYEHTPKWVKSLLASAYTQVPDGFRYGAKYEAFCQEIRLMRDASKEAIEQYQIEQIQRSLEAAERTPFYQQSFAAHGVRGSDFKELSDLKKFPCLSKSDLVQSREWMLNPDQPSSNRLYMSTGGSSGTPVGFYLQRGISRPKEKAHLNQMWKQVGWDRSHRSVILRGHHVSERSNGSIYYDDPIRQARVFSSAHLSPSRMAEYVERMQAFEPDYLDAYPSSALILTRWMEERGLHFSASLKYLLCGSEKLSPQDQTYLESYHGVRVMHWYGHSERVVLARQFGPSQHLYFVPTYGYVELDEPNVEGYQEVIGTSFHNSVMPIIRYRTGDLVKVPTIPQKEGVGLEIEQVIGRSYEWLLSSNHRRVSLTAFNRHDEIFDDVFAIQFSQRELGKVEFRYQPLKKFDAKKLEKMKLAVQAKLGDDFEIDFKEVEEIERSKLGKCRWLVDSIIK